MATIKIKTLNPKYQNKNRYFFDVPEFVYYEGLETKAKWVNAAEYICLTTGIKDFPMRIVPRKLIVEQDGVSVSLDLAQTRTVLIKGSTGSDYVVSLGENSSCTCTGFQFRNHCKHLAEAEKVVL